MFSIKNYNFLSSVIVITLLIFLFSIYNTSYSNQNDIFRYRKDPMLAAILSFHIPGLGQAYSGNLGKGALFFVAEETLLWSALLNVSTFRCRLVKDFGIEIGFKMRENLSDTRIYTSVGLGILYLAVKVYDIYDAIETAKNYNNRLLKRELKKPGLDSNFNFGLGYYNQTPSLVFSTSF